MASSSQGAEHAWAGSYSPRRALPGSQPSQRRTVQQRARPCCPASPRGTSEPPGDPGPRPAVDTWRASRDRFEPGHLRGDVGPPALFGVGQLGRHSGRLFGGRPASSPARAVLRRPFRCSKGLGTGQVGDGPAGFGAPVGTLPGLEVGQVLLDPAESGPAAASSSGLARPLSLSGRRRRLRLGQGQGDDAGYVGPVEWADLAYGISVAGQPGVDGPGRRAPGGPVPAQVVGGLGHVVGNDPGVGGLPGPAHGHIGQFPAAAVGEKVSPCSGRSLRAVDRGGVAESQAVGAGARRSSGPGGRRRSAA